MVKNGPKITKSVDINNGAKVIQLVESGKVDGFPNVSLQFKNFHYNLYISKIN